MPYSDLEKQLIQAARDFNNLPLQERMAMREAQRRSWVIGEMMLSHPEMTREQAEATYDKMLAG